MKKVCKAVCRILGIIIGFIIVNLVIGTIKYGGTQAYSKILNQKDWQQSLSEISLLKPKTRVAMFYQDSQENIEKGVEQALINDMNIEDTSDIEGILNEVLSGENNEEDVNHNPYDPDYEDEFNSFFGGSTEENSEIIPVEEIEDLEPAGFVVDENAED